jgi:hypothetical protein
MAHQILSSPPLDFIRLTRKLTIFGAEHAFTAPTLAYVARCPQRHGQSTAATDH